MDKYHISENNQILGIYTIDELKNIVFNENTLVWKKGMEEWVKAGEIVELKKILEDKEVGTPPPFKHNEELPPPLPFENDIPKYNNLAVEKSKNYKLIGAILAVILSTAFYFQYVITKNFKNNDVSVDSTIAMVDSTVIAVVDDVSKEDYIYYTNFQDKLNRVSDDLVTYSFEKDGTFTELKIKKRTGDKKVFKGTFIVNNTKYANTGGEFEYLKLTYGEDSNPKNYERFLVLYNGNLIIPCRNSGLPINDEDEHGLIVDDFYVKTYLSWQVYSPISK